MTSPFVPNDMSPKERAQHGAALAKGAAFDGVYGLWRRRNAEGWTRSRVANNVDVDEGWLSKQFIGPRNWTMESFGTLVEGLQGEVTIIVRAAEDRPSDFSNYDAYAEYGISSEQQSSSNARAAQVPSQKGNYITSYPQDISKLFEMFQKNEAAPVPVS